MRSLVCLIMIFLFTTPVYCREFSLQSSSFSNLSKLPVLFSCDGKSVSPALIWTNPPKNTKSYALLMTNSDSPLGVFYGWVLFNIPAEVTRLEEGANKDLPAGIVVGNNSYSEASYSAPCPVDSLIHQYIFTLYALDDYIGLSEGASIQSVIYAIKKRALKRVDLIGEYSH